MITIYKRRNQKPIKIEAEFVGDIKTSKKTKKQVNGDCSYALGVATCGLSYLLAPCLICIP